MMKTPQFLFWSSIVNNLQRTFWIGKYITNVTFERKKKEKIKTGIIKS